MNDNCVNEVLALKTLGLSLASIADLLQGKAADLGRTLAIQQDALHEVRERAGRGLAMIEILQTKVAGGGTLTITDLTKLAKESNMADTTKDAVAWRRYEQNRPRTEVPIDTSIYADYAGFYRLKDGPFYVVSTRDGQLFPASPRSLGQNTIGTPALVWHFYAFEAPGLPDSWNHWTEDGGVISFRSSGTRSIETSTMAGNRFSTRPFLRSGRHCRSRPYEAMWRETGRL